MPNFNEEEETTDDGEGEAVGEDSDEEGGEGETEEAFGGTEDRYTPGYEVSRDNAEAVEADNRARRLEPLFDG
jgi:hypothetical protein